MDLRNWDPRQFGEDIGYLPQDVPRSIRPFAIFGMLLMLVTFGGFGAWVFMAPLAVVVLAPGFFVATGQNKTVADWRAASSRRS